MKTFIAVFFMVFGFFRIFAQETIEVNIEQRTSSLGIEPAFEVKVPQATAKAAVSLWEKTVAPGKLLKKTPKMEKVEDEWIVDDVLLEDITSSELKVISQIDSYSGHIYFRAFFKEGEQFIGAEGSSENESAAASRYVRNYAVELYRQAVGEELKEEEKTLSNLESDLKRLKKQNSNLEDKIAEAKQDQNEFQAEVTYTRGLIKDGLNLTEESKKEFEEKLKSAEKDLKKAEKEESGLNKKVKDNNKEQQDKSFEIDKQKAKVEQVKTKLSNIK